MASSEKKRADKREEKESGEATGVESDEKFTFFFGAKSPFSQWHPAVFTVDGVEYNCAEQYMMHQKASKCRTQYKASSEARFGSHEHEATPSRSAPAPQYYVTRAHKSTPHAPCTSASVQVLQGCQVDFILESCWFKLAQCSLKSSTLMPPKCGVRCGSTDRNLSF